MPSWKKAKVGAARRRLVDAKAALARAERFMAGGLGASVDLPAARRKVRDIETEILGMGVPLEP
jgi:hypothetical protein